MFTWKYIETLYHRQTLSFTIQRQNFVNNNFKYFLLPSLLRMFIHTQHLPLKTPVTSPSSGWGGEPSAYNSQIQGRTSRPCVWKSNLIPNEANGCFTICAQLPTAERQGTVETARDLLDLQIAWVGSEATARSGNQTLPCDGNKWTNRVQILGANTIANKDH
jgi:hypothetical protein